MAALNLISSSRELLSSDLTPLQSQLDGWVGGFVEQATDWRSLAAMTAGGITYRLGRMGVMASGAGRLASLGIGLGTEVTAFEMTNRSLASLTGDTRSNPNLWRWDGNGGIRQGLLSSLITFGSLKGAGRLAQGENTVVQHLLQDTGMVLGHQVSGALGITPRPTGTLAEQFLHAEATSLQLSAGMALAHSVAPGVQGLERGLDLSIRGREIPSAPLFQRGEGRDFAFAGANGSRTVAESFPPNALAMSAVKDETPQGPPVAESHQSGETTAVRHPAIALFLKVAEKEGKRLEDLEGIVSQDELLSLARLPGSPMVPTREDSRQAIMNQIFSDEKNLREKFETFKEILEDPHHLGRAFACASGNHMAVVFSSLEYIQENRPEETLERLARPDREVLSEDLEDTREDLLKSLAILGELFRIFNTTESGPFLHGAVIGRDKPGSRGIRFHYRNFESKILSGLSQDSPARLGLESVPNYRQLMLRTWRLTRTRSGS